MMAEMMNDSGSITACDVHKHRLDLIQASARRLGISIIETRLADGTVHNSDMDDMYDFVLADVPCSGLGVMSTKPEIRLRMDTKSIQELPSIQLEILKNAFRYTKPGGRICYSTCTLNKAENEAVIEAFRESDPAFGRIVEMQTVLPYNNLIGFYYCIIEKNVH
jgi:16S rRNA (cytosine967-C5)-methyltransferase